jgi:hypothetical protein
MVIMQIIHTRVLLMAITVHDGLWAEFSSVRARGITAITDPATATTVALATATTVADTTGLELTFTTGVVLATRMAMHADL